MHFLSEDFLAIDFLRNESSGHSFAGYLIGPPLNYLPQLSERCCYWIRASTTATNQSDSSTNVYCFQTGTSKIDQEQCSCLSLQGHCSERYPAGRELLYQRIYFGHTTGSFPMLSQLTLLMRANFQLCHFMMG